MSPDAEPTVWAVFTAKAWVAMAALAGSATGAWFLRPRTRLEWLVTVAGGFFASVFVAPYLITKWFPGAQGASPEVALTYYITSLVAMFAIPGFIRAMLRRFETPSDGNRFP